ncbi:hypothetical protein GA0074692_1176 [Micromonospora pallida]|uniref:Uncharacterized protein n=1 Tax=Micromonospora pallida TaxID=145854 RepID=A0A1C6RW29_9ACTN|nr:hypothetical protein GA0074692_1176 [Micromonospora pallida]
MSWSLFVIPLHGLSRNGMSEWIASARFVRGRPDRVPEALPLPSVIEVLNALRSSGCHGTNWFEIVGEEAGSRLPECPNPGTCASTGGLDLGEVSVYTAGRASSLPPVPADAVVETVTFRKPNGVAALSAACALASVGGPQLVFDETATEALVVWPGDGVGKLGDDWPW